jgi:hypothetical protein
MSNMDASGGVDVRYVQPADPTPKVRAIEDERFGGSGGPFDPGDPKRRRKREQPEDQVSDAGETSAYGVADRVEIGTAPPPGPAKGVADAGVHAPPIPGSVRIQA